MASFFSAMAAGLYLVNAERLTQKYGSFTQVITLYYMGGAIGGSVVGLAWPLTRWQEGAAFVGFLAVLPMYLGAGLLLGVLDDATGFITGLVLAAFVGGRVGYHTWEPWGKPAKPRTSR